MTARSSQRLVPGLVALAVLMAGPVVAFAQPTVAQHSEHVTDAAPSTDETAWTLQLGAILNTGNTRSFAINGGSKLAIKRSQNVFAAEVAGTYGRASVRDVDTDEFGPSLVNTETIFVKGRYDRFFSEMDAAFVSAGYLHDRFAGLDSRVQGQVGYLRNFFKWCEGKHRFWGEIGYDLTLDNFEPETVDPGTATLHSARLFLGYDNHLYDHVTFLTGLEALFDVEDLDNVRLASVSELRSKIMDKLQFSVQFALRLDNVPVENRDKVDTTTTLNLIYSLI